MGPKVQISSPSSTEKSDKINFVYNLERKRTSKTSQEAQGAIKILKPLQEVILPNVMVGIVREASKQVNIITEQVAEEKEKADRVLEKA